MGYDIQDVEVDGCDFSTEIIKRLNSKPYKISLAKSVRECVDFTRNNDQQAGPDIYPYPIMEERYKDKYTSYFEEDWTLKEKFAKKIKFYEHDINDLLPKNYDMVTCIHTINHVVSFFRKKSDNVTEEEVRGFIFDLFDKMLSRVNYLLVINKLCYNNDEAEVYFSYCESKNLKYEVGGEYIYIFKNL
jgi:hypothetical protein